jgi:hypothetical protein
MMDGFRRSMPPAEKNRNAIPRNSHPGVRAFRILFFSEIFLAYRHGSRHSFAMNDPLPPTIHSLCDLLRVTAGAFVTEVHGHTPPATRLRTEFDCLLSLWAAGDLNPIQLFNQTRQPVASPESIETVPLH